MTVYCVDPTEVVFNLIAKSAPERGEPLKAFWGKYSVCFERADDKTGIVLNADKDRVEFTCKDLQVMWLLGFALWKSIELFSPAVILPASTEDSSSSVLDCDGDLDDLEYRYRERMAAVVELIGAEELDRQRWPPDIPLPVESSEELTNTEDIATFDLVMMAISVLFLHELKHVEFHAQHAAGIPRPEKFAEEELQCDMWARDWFFSALAEYARESGYSYEGVCSKRAMGLLLVCEYLRLADQNGRVVISTDYPPLASRISALTGDINLPDNDNCWIFSACILMAETRRQGKTLPKLEGVSFREISERLIDVLTPSGGS